MLVKGQTVFPTTVNRTAFNVLKNIVKSLNFSRLLLPTFRKHKVSNDSRVTVLKQYILNLPKKYENYNGRYPPLQERRAFL